MSCPHQQGDKESAQRGQAWGVSCSPCQHQDPPAHSRGIGGQELPGDKIPHGCGNPFPAGGGCTSTGRDPGWHPKDTPIPKHFHPALLPAAASPAKEGCAGTQPSSSSSSSCSRPGQSHPHHCALDKLPFKGVCLIPYLPSVRSRSSCRRGRGGRNCRALLSYELFLTHVYNFHKSFLQHGERKKGGGEGGRKREREGERKEIQFAPAKAAGQMGRQGGEAGEQQGRGGRDVRLHPAGNTRESQEGQAGGGGGVQGHTPTEGSEAPVTGI